MINNLFLLILLTYQFFIYDINAQCEGAVRLTGGPTEYGDPEYSGLIEIFYEGLWGTICDDGIDHSTDPIFTVVCTELGYDTVIEGWGENGPSPPGPDTPFGKGAGDMWLDDVDCNGGEAHPGLCPSAGWGSGNGGCSHSEDISVHCGGYTGVVDEVLLGLDISCTDDSECCEGRVCYNDECTAPFDALVQQVQLQGDALDTLITQSQSDALDELKDELTKCCAKSSDSSDENAAALMENYEMDNNENDVEKYHSLTVEFSDSTMITIWIFFGLCIVISILCFFCNNKK